VLEYPQMQAPARADRLIVVEVLMGKRKREDGVTFADVVAAKPGEERERLISALVSRMSLEEKIRQMAGSASLLGLAWMLVAYGSTTYDSGANKRLGIPPIRFTDGPRGICLDHSTCFPVAMARAATWDEDLNERVGSAVGIEARAQGADFYGGVCINVPRHPGWGRAQETFGEDPYLLGVLGSAMVRGVQRHVMACAKHLACNSMEEARFHVDVRIDERALREVYLPHFKMCVDTGVASIMSAYNKVNGDYCGHNSRLLHDILKEEWGFDGLVMSDFVYGVRNGKRSALAGLDLEMPYRWRFGIGFKGTVKHGGVPESAIDKAATRVLRQKARFAGVGEEPGTYDISKVACPEHTRLALETARKAIVLLKNEKRALPLDRGGVKRVAVIGKLAAKANIGDMGSSRVKPPYVVTPLDGIRKLAAGAVEVVYESGKDLEAALHAASEADATIVFAGLTGRDEGEFMPFIHTGGDRADLGLPRGQDALIKAVAARSDRCIVVLEGGSAILTGAWQDDVEAILVAWYPGMEGGNALAEVLFGEVNPGGKLPVTFPPSNDQNPPFDKKAKTAEYGYYHGYRMFDKKGMAPAFAFGFGLSYTEYSYSNMRLSDNAIGKTGKVLAEVDVTNTGEVAGEEIVQLYVAFEGSGVDRPVKELKGFKRVALDPGQTKTVSLEVAAEDLAWYDASRGEWLIEEADYLVCVGPSSREEDLTLRDKFTVWGA
jgi:beta-glucosidase